MSGRSPTRVAVAVACLAGIQACDGSPPAERELAHADAEVFEVVVRSERAFGAEDSARARFLRIDSRPIDNTTLMPAQTSLPAGIALDNDSAQPSSRAVERIVRARRAILQRLGVEEGGPFVFPGCGGVRTGERPSDPGADPSAADCPTEWRRYVTIGLPRRGVGQIPEKLRRPEPQSFDTSEVWSVIVTESSIGVGGQDWRQYAWVLARQPGRADLSVATRFLLSRAE